MTRRGACFVDPYPVHLLGVIARWLNKKAESPQFFAPLLAQLRKSFYLCTAIENKSFSDWALSSAGSERLPYKQRVGGSNPSAPTFFQTAIHRKMDSCFFCARTKRRGLGTHTQVWRSAVRKTGIYWSCRRLFCVGMSDGCSFSCERVCAVVIGIWCLLLEKPIDEWRCSLKKRREKEKRRGKLSISSPVFYPTFRTTAYAFLWQTRKPG